jgi:hypothetical protein
LVIDVSVSGVELSAETVPEVGTVLAIGQIVGDALGMQAAQRPHSSSVSRFTAGAAGFLTLIQWPTRPAR